jgi:uncharacterized membrane protein YhaH (DUF805 family)
MGRPLFYFTTVLFQAMFWLIELLANYSDYLEGSPIFLKKPYVEMFNMNRIPLLVSELLVPLVMLVSFIALAVIKLRSTGIRYAYLLILFIAMEFWMVRAFIFPDRMLRYYQMSDPEYYQNAGQGDPFLYYFIAHVVLFALVVIVKEYSYIPEDELIAARQNKPNN